MDIRNRNTFKPTTFEELQRQLIAIVGDRRYIPLSWDLSNIDDLSDLFSSYHFNRIDFNTFSFISDWNVSHVTNMKGMFKGCMRFNLPLDRWIVSNVTNMESMFEYCIQFNQPLNNWTVSSVTNMKGMFKRCDIFNQPLNNWVVSSVTNMENMFEQCDKFNQPLESWTVSSVTNMKGMFKKCRYFNKPLNNWVVSSVTNMENMFEECISFNQPLDNWIVSSVTNMEYMFKGCYTFNKPLNNWVVSSVTNMESMFNECQFFNQPLDGWTVSSVTNMKGMFQNSHSFNQPLDNWVVSSVTNMESMFHNCSKFNQPLNNWNVSSVTNMKNMFTQCEKFNQPLTNWVLNRLEMYNDDYKMFDKCPISNENKPQRIKKLEQLRRSLKYAYFDNSLTMPEITAIKQSFLNILNTQGFDDKGHIKLNRIGDYFESNDINNVNVPKDFCDPYAMDSDYIFDSINSQHYILLVSYYENLQDIHTMMTIAFEENKQGSIGLYLDALCVNNAMGYKGAGLLLTKLVDALELMSTPNIEYIRLTSVPAQNTLDFYKKNNFQITGPINYNLIEHNRPIVGRTITVASPSNVMPGGSLTSNKHTSNSFQKNELLSVLTNIIEMKKNNDAISNPSMEGVEVDDIIIPLRKRNRVPSKGSPTTKRRRTGGKRRGGKKTVRKIKKHIKKHIRKYK
jgi:surface protein